MYLKGSTKRARLYAVQTLEERFWPKVDKVTAACWLWTGGLRNGYGCISSGPPNKRMLQAPIVAWWLATGHWPMPGEWICHDCPGGDNRVCVRNDTVGVYVLDGVSYEKRGHLWLGTQAANNRDLWLKGRSNWQTGEQPDKRGERNVNAVLNAETVLEMRRLYATGDYTFEAIGILFDVHTMTAHRAIVGKTWAHL